MDTNTSNIKKLPATPTMIMKLRSADFESDSPEVSFSSVGEGCAIIIDVVDNKSVDTDNSIIIIDVVEEVVDDSVIITVVEGSSVDVDALFIVTLNVGNVLFIKGVDVELFIDSVDDEDVLDVDGGCDGVAVDKGRVVVVGKFVDIICIIIIVEDNSVDVDDDVCLNDADDEGSNVDDDDSIDNTSIAKKDMHSIPQTGQVILHTELCIFG